MNSENKNAPVTISRESILYYGVTDRGFDSFNIGDRIEISMIVQDKNKERIQKFEGDVIGMRGQGVCQTFKVRKIGEANIGIEMTYPYHSPMISAIKLVRKGLVRRAKLNYLRNAKSQKDAKIKTKDVFFKGAGK